MKIRVAFLLLVGISSPCFSAVDFNASTSFFDRIEAPVISTKTNVTMCAWMKPAALPQIGMVMANGDPNGGGYAIGIGFNGGSASTLLVAHELSAWVNCGFTFQTNQWYHIAYTRDGSTMRAYVNGVQNCTSANVPTDPYSSGRLAIGASYSSLVTPTAARMFRGSIEDARFYNYALSADELKYLASTRQFVPYNVSRMLTWTKLNDAPPSRYGLYVGTTNIVDSSYFRKTIQTKGAAINFATGILNYMGD